MKKYKVLLLLILLSFASCTISTPFRKIEGNSDKDPNRIVLVSFTHVILGENSDINELFWDYVFKINDQISTTDGAIGHSLRKKIFADEGWTMSVWEDHNWMMQFVDSDLHKEALEKTASAISKVEYARVKMPLSKVPPSWEEAEKYLLEQNLPK